jgi:hypothetical protein
MTKKVFHSENTARHAFFTIPLLTPCDDRVVEDHEPRLMKLTLVAGAFTISHTKCQNKGPFEFLYGW